MRLIIALLLVSAIASASAYSEHGSCARRRHREQYGGGEQYGGEYGHGGGEGHHGRDDGPYDEPYGNHDGNYVAQQGAAPAANQSATVAKVRQH